MKATNKNNYLLTWVETDIALHIFCVYYFVLFFQETTIINKDATS